MSDTGLSKSPRKFGVNTLWWILSLSPFVFVLSSIVLTSCFISFSIFGTASKFPIDLRTQYISVLFIPLACLIVLFGILFIISIGRLSLTRIEVSSDGISYRMWPTFYVNTTWDGIDRIETRKLLGLISYDYLILNDKAHITGLGRGLRRLFNSQNTILLSDLRGWPHGALADAIKSNAPPRVIQPKMMPNNSLKRTPDSAEKSN